MNDWKSLKITSKILIMSKIVPGWKKAIINSAISDIFLKLFYTLGVVLNWRPFERSGWKISYRMMKHCTTSNSKQLIFINSLVWAFHFSPFSVLFLPFSTTPYGETDPSIRNLFATPTFMKIAEVAHW